MSWGWKELLKSEVLEKIKKAIDENIWYDEGDNIHIDEDDYMNEIEQIISEYEDGMLVQVIEERIKKNG